MIVVEGAEQADGNEQILHLLLFAVAVAVGVGVVAFAHALAVLQLYNWLM